MQLPENFDFSHQEGWPKRSRRFERFRQASGLLKEEEESQIITLIYAMGDQADDSLTSFKLTITQLKQYHTVKTKFDEHFAVRRFGGSRDSAVVRALAFHQCGPGSIRGLDVICGLSLLLVLFSAPRGFSPGTPVFPSPQKPTFLNSNSIRNARAFNT